MFEVCLDRMTKACSGSEVSMEVLYGNCSVRRRPLVTWLRHPRGISRSVWAGPFDMCRLCNSLSANIRLVLRDSGLPTPPSMILAAILGLEVLCWETGITVALPNAVRKETFQGHLGGPSMAATVSTSQPFTTASEHC